MNNPIISLTTDFGSSDYDAGVLSGVIWSIAPHAKIAEITHEITPYNILEGALILGRCTPYFPEDSIHITVVDPGVGTLRRGLAARIGKQYFVGPDNGLCTVMVEQAIEAGMPAAFHSLDNPKYWLPDVTHIFHGRDIFAPIAAHLAAGVPLENLGTQINDPILLNIPKPVQTENGWRGTILHVDHFGNLTSNLTTLHFSKSSQVEIILGETRITHLQSTYGSAKPGDLLALIDDSGNLEIAVSQGSAEKRLNSGIGTEFDLVFKE